MHASAQERRWGVAEFAAFWTDPRLDLPTDELADDVVGWWPGEQAPRRGIAAYALPLRVLLEQVPDFRLEVVDHAEAGDLSFIHWRAHGTWRGERLDFHGVDRIRQHAGQVVENRIFCRHPLIETILAQAGAAG